MTRRFITKNWFTRQRLALVLVLFALTASIAPSFVGGRVLTVSAAVPPACQSILYVNATASGANNGSSWRDAYTSLSAALAQANSCETVAQIWVAKGTYRPDATGLEDPRTATFALKSNLAIYGGFTTEQNSLSQRDLNPATNGTVLSGDLNNNDGPDFFVGIDDNCYHVVTGSGTDNTAILDGFTITRGWAYNLSGGGIWNVTGSPTLTNLIISGNLAVFFGAGIENQEESNPILTNVIISGNAVSGIGGGMANFSSNPTLTNVIISGNSGIFGDNKGGGLANISSSPTLTNVTITGNSAGSGEGGGIFNSFRSSPIIRNSIVWGNSGGEIVNENSNPNVSYSIVQGGYGGTGNRSTDPYFVTPVPAGRSTGGDLHLQPISNAINGGNKLVTNPALPATDLDGNPRISGITVDMGAYEFKAAPTIALLTVNPIAGQNLNAASLATITDVDDDESTLDVTVTYVSGSGVTISGVSIDASGNLTANITTNCNATNSTFTVRATDLGGLFSTTTLTVTIRTNQLPVLSYPFNPASVYGTETTVSPLTGPSDDVGINSIVVQSITPSDPGGITVASNGVVTIGNTVPVGTYTVTIRANAVCANNDASFTLGVVKATPTISWNNPADITYGTALSGTQLNATANVEGSFTYSPSSGTVLNVGNGQTLSVTFTPNDSANYTTATKNVSINVLKATPTITWANPADIIYGTALSATQLNATTSVDGSFVYSPANGTVLNAGLNQSLSVTFSPTDTANYNSTMKTVNINVLQATPTITWNNPADIVYGTALSATQLNATANVAGMFTYSPASGTVLNAGTGQILAVTFTPMDNANYKATDKQVTINVLKATPLLSWNNPTDIVYGTALSATQLNATANVAGTFSYSPAIGTILTAGNQVLTANFTPNDTANYNSTSKQVPINVLKVPLTVTVNNAWRNQGAVNPVFSGTINGLVNGDVITASYSTTAVQNSPGGIYPITATLLDLNNRLGNYTVTNTPGTLTVLASCSAAISPTSLPSGKSGQSYNAPLSVVALLSSVAGPYTFIQVAGQLPPGVNLVNNNGAFALNGVPTTAGPYTFTLLATRNAGGCSRAVTYTVTILPL